MSTRGVINTCESVLLIALCATLVGCGSASAPSLAVEPPAPSAKQTTAAANSEAQSTPPKTDSTAVSVATSVNPMPAPLPAVEPVAAKTTTLQPKLMSVEASQLIGKWRDSFFGTRTLTLNADGTARMELDLDFAGRLLYGSRLDFDMRWQLEGATVTIDVIDGTPAKAAKSAMSTFGTRYVYLLDCVEDHTVEMRDDDGSMSHKLKRIPDDPKPAEPRQ